jgi:hypothetical protein
MLWNIATPGSRTQGISLLPTPSIYRMIRKWKLELYGIRQVGALHANSRKWFAESGRSWQSP